MKLLMLRVLSFLVVLILLSLDSVIGVVAETSNNQKHTKANLKTQNTATVTTGINSDISYGTFEKIEQQQKEERVQQRILQSTTPVCTGVSNEESLFQAINSVPYNRFFASKITICNDIQLSSVQYYNNTNFPYGNTKFDISNRNIALVCGRIGQSLQNKARCNIIGSATTNMRLFYGINTILTSERIDYSNGGNNDINSSSSRNNIVEKGGAFYIIGRSRLIFRDTNFINNTVSQIGGAVYVDDTTQITLSTYIGQSSRSRVASVNFINNFSNNIGGAIALVGSNIILRTITMSGTTNTTLRIASFRTNIATNYGGAIAMTFQSQFPIFSSDITNSNNNSLTLSRLFFDRNQATVGGAIGGYDPDKVIIQSCVFTNNIASLTGGAIYSTSSSSTVLSKLVSITSSDNRNIFTNNTSIL